MTFSLEVYKTATTKIVWNTILMGNDIYTLIIFYKKTLKRKPLIDNIISYDLLNNVLFYVQW